ncbi:MAG: molybdopterin-dependent oxidoreductase [bacterium]
METVRLANVVLPTASFVEKDGTFTNTDRVPPKTLFIHFRFAETTTNILTNSVYDPIAKIKII